MPQWTRRTLAIVAMTVAGCGHDPSPMERAVGPCKVSGDTMWVQGVPFVVTIRSCP